MRFLHPGGSIVHLAYCTNVHSAEDLPGIHAQLSGFCARVRSLLGVPRLGVGLWLPAGAARALLDDPRELVRLRAALDSHGLEVVTLNGFPYRGFQQEVVKHRVYSPDWSSPERLRYTLDLAAILAALLPDDVTEGSISTLPLAWRTEGAPTALLKPLVEGLREVRSRTGRTIRVAFEPEPGCVIETTAQAAELLPRDELLGVCLDACHLAVGFEGLDFGDLPIVKLQASCALETPPGAQRALGAYDEARFLHQTRCASGYADDLGEALARLPYGERWRTHFHMPLHAAPPPPLTTTAGYLGELLRTVLAAPLTRHIEVETYTWSVLPEPDVTGGIAAELDWMRRELAVLGLKEL
ncbi:metabolite traffic protein EboE [Nonomuraea sp. bgisy101]|uniref:metabolite traffic protein EboE n=1 Tax=Nonomuraea sp. bgisy101 TaxID=3413784 RepID=UPI003D7274C2